MSEMIVVDVELGDIWVGMVVLVIKIVFTVYGFGIFFNWSLGHF